MSIQTYDVKIKTIGPVHIGASEVLKKQDYIYDYHQSMVHIVDRIKLMRFLKEKNLLDTYHTFLMYPPKIKKERQLKNYLDRNNIKRTEWNYFIKYSERVYQGESLKNKKVPTVNDIQLMMRDGQNKVYIPGSSIKGALKIALVSEYNNDNDTLFYSKLRISDSQPIDDSKLAIYQKVDVNKKLNPMSLYRECVDVNTDIHFTITIEDNILTIEQIKQSLNKFYNNYYEKWLSGFESTVGGKNSSIIVEHLKLKIVILCI